MVDNKTIRRQLGSDMISGSNPIREEKAIVTKTTFVRVYDFMNKRFIIVPIYERVKS